MFVSFSINSFLSARFGIRDYGIDLSPTELEQVFLYFDASKDGFISVDEFLIDRKSTRLNSSHRR